MDNVTGAIANEFGAVIVIQPFTGLIVMARDRQRRLTAINGFQGLFIRRPVHQHIPGKSIRVPDRGTVQRDLPACFRSSDAIDRMSVISSRGRYSQSKYIRTVLRVEISNIQSQPVLMNRMSIPASYDLTS